MVVEKEVSEIVEEVKKHRLFYMQSGGGITFSGGETTMQREFLNELSETLYDMGFHLAMETCGYFDFDALKPVLQRMDLIFMDLILSILVDTFFSRISLTMLPVPNPHNTSCVLS